MTFEPGGPGRSGARRRRARGTGVDGAFGIDAFTADDRLRLFHFAAAEKRHEYLWLLRAFDRARANYQVLMHVSDAQAASAALPGAARRPDADVQALLDSLAEWQVLDRSYDGTRAANLAEYRNRHYVYQFTQAGYRAYRAVEEVLSASLEDAQLSRLVFPDILADLQALAEAARGGDAAEVYRKLSRLDGVLADMAQRAARFYLMLGDLARTNDTRPEVFLAHKDALLTHMREFHSELSRYAPLLAVAVDAVAAVSAAEPDLAARLAAEADDSLFRTPAERVARVAAPLGRSCPVVRRRSRRGPRRRQRGRPAAGRHHHRHRQRDGAAAAGHRVQEGRRQPGEPAAPPRPVVRPPARRR